MTTHLTFDEAIREEVAGKNPDVYFLDDFFHHFAEVVENANGHMKDAVTDEGERVCGLIVGGEVEDESLLSCLVQAVAAGAEQSVFKALGLMLGVSPRVVQSALAGYTEGHETAAVGVEGLRSEIAAAEAAEAERATARAARRAEATS